ncbi:hypothetical protein CDAR_506851 [Caerostris darwini]|uniref:Uncharacterized protein n=1 Tax=Caerostris darwini TaxID=1538125 RepID=A0AAV4P583_9ARAC|nr:hypothetical protein CDAR_506851 [Caerostris darwini]
MQWTKHKHLTTHKATTHWHGCCESSPRHMACGDFLCKNLDEMGTITPLPLTSLAKSHFRRRKNQKRKERQQEIKEKSDWEKKVCGDIAWCRSGSAWLFKGFPLSQ